MRTYTQPAAALNSAAADAACERGENSGKLAQTGTLKARAERRIAEIEGYLDAIRLSLLAESQEGTRNWGDLGTLAYIAEHLRPTAQSLTNRGEYAEVATTSARGGR